MNNSDVDQDFSIIPITPHFQDAAKQLVLDGLKERFGFLDRSLNPDLNDILGHYSQSGIFLIGLCNGRVVCTGALTNEDGGIGRIQRMSVQPSFRRIGLARRMIESLETEAAEKGYTHLILETNNDWGSAISFYKAKGYQLDWKDDQRSHFIKSIEHIYIKEQDKING